MADSISQVHELLESKGIMPANTAGGMRLTKREVQHTLAERKEEEAEKPTEAPESPEDETTLAKNVIEHELVKRGEGALTTTERILEVPSSKPLPRPHEKKSDPVSVPHARTHRQMKQPGLRTCHHDKVGSS